MNRYLVVALVVFAVSAGIYWFVPTPRSGADRETLAIGERVYRTECAICHGASLEGQPNWQSRNAAGRLPAPPHDASGHTWHHPMQVLFEITKYGVGRFAGPGYVSDMPVYEARLSDGEIWAVLAYIREQWPSDVRKRHSEIEAQIRK
ncbi:c-type cytochrome [Sphingomonas daechungensis]|uniref:c-type cytochrome n=1 Tax=Sphingomonas daechungensis TaxID=1176646 RepID=UPI003783F07F